MFRSFIGIVSILVIIGCLIASGYILGQYFMGKEMYEWADEEIAGLEDDIKNHYLPRIELLNDSLEVLAALEAEIDTQYIREKIYIDTLHLLPADSIADLVVSTFYKGNIFASGQVEAAAIDDRTIMVSKVIAVDYIGVARSVAYYQRKYTIAMDMLEVSQEISFNQLNIIENHEIMMASMTGKQLALESRATLWRCAFYATAVTGGLLLVDVRPEYALTAGGGTFLVSYGWHQVNRVFKWIF